MPCLFYRANADTVIGFGHVYRALFLKYYWENAGEEFLLVTNRIPQITKEKLGLKESQLVEVTKAYKNEGKHFDYGCCILPTSPLIKIENLKKAFELLQNEVYDSVRPIVPFSYPIQRALKFYNGCVEMFNPENKRKRSQDLETAYHDAGQFYWFQFDKGMHSERKGAIILSDYEVQDIDDEEDWKLAELKYSLNDEK